MILSPKYIRSLRRLSAVLVLLLVLAACSEPALAPAPQVPTDAFGGFAEISFSDLNSNPDASVSVLSAATISGQVFNFQGGISFDSATRVVAVNDVGSSRFVSVDIDVLNGSGATLSNITFLPFSQQGVSFNDSPVGATPFVVARTVAGARFAALDEIKPSHGVDATGTVEASRADFVAYQESELQQIATDLVDTYPAFAPNVLSIYPYAFVARNKATPDSRTIADGARGTVSLTLRVPLQDVADDNLDDVSVRVFFTTDTRTRVTEGAFGDSFANAVTRAQTIGATEIVAIGPGTRNIGGSGLTPIGLDNVRLTGTASLPTGFLLDLSGPPTFTSFTPVYVDDSAPPGGDGSSPARALQTITLGVETVAPNGAIIVAAGTYTESVIINKPLSLRGPNENTDPTVGTRGGEARLIPPVTNLSTSTTGSQNFLIAIEADDVSINGFELNGDNPSLSGGEVLNGVDVDVAYGILNRFGGRDNVSVTNNVIRNLYYRGVALSGTTTTSFSGRIANNFFDNLPFIDTNIPADGRAVALANNYYADVENNLIERVYIGIATTGFNVGGSPASVSNNRVSSRRIGIWINNHFTSASAFTLGGNTISSIDTDNPDRPATGNTGIFLTSIQTSVVVNLNNNDVSDAFAAVEFYNDPTSSTIEVTGGTLTGNLYGILLYSRNAAFSPQNDTAIGIDGVTITQTLTANRSIFEPAGIYVLDNGTADLTATIAAGTTINVTGIGPQAVEESNPTTTGTATITNNEASITVDNRSITPGPGPLSVTAGRYFPRP